MLFIFWGSYPADTKTFSRRHHGISKLVCETSWGLLKWKSQLRKLRCHKDVAWRHYFKTSLWRLHAVIATVLIQLLLQVWLLYWVHELGFLLSCKHIKIDIWLKIEVESIYVHWSCFHVDQTTPKHHWQYFLFSFSLDSRSTKRLSYVLRHKAYTFFSKKLTGQKNQVELKQNRLDTI